jgi:O-antigen/teichoic acid export membrane protein
LIVVFVLGDQIITVYFGPQFSEAALGLRLLVPGALCYALARVLWPVIQAGGAGMSLIRVMLATVMADVGLSMILIPAGGAAGAACATSLSFALVAGCDAWILRRRKVSIFEGLAWPRLLALVVVTGIAISACSALVSTPMLSLLVGVAVGVLFYWAGVFSLGIVQVNELESLVQSLPGTFRHAGEMAFRTVAPWLLRLKAATSN